MIFLMLKKNRHGISALRLFRFSLLTLGRSNCILLFLKNKLNYKLNINISEYLKFQAVHLTRPVMIKSSTVRDPYPRFKAAGISTLRNGEELSQNTTDIGLSLKEEPGTPEHMKKYRKSYKMQAGTKILHHGIYDDAKPTSNFIYGKPTLVSDHVSKVFENPNEGIKQYLNEIKEAKYASNIREPLGKTFTRNYSMPSEITQNPNFKFGVAVVQSEASKNVIFPLKEDINEPEEAKRQYLKSHQTYEAGEQRDRGYNWQVDPKNHRFGKENPQITKEMSQVLQPEYSQDS